MLCVGLYTPHGLFASTQGTPEEPGDPVRAEGSVPSRASPPDDFYAFDLALLGIPILWFA